MVQRVSNNIEENSDVFSVMQIHCGSKNPNPYKISQITLTECFDAVGWAARRASGL